MGFEIQTRQETEVLASSAAPLGSGESFTSAPREISGYAEISVFAVSDRPFSIAFLEATDVALENGVMVGNFVRAQALITATQVGAQWRVCQRLNPCGKFGKFVLTNLGADMSELSFAASGLPLP